MVAARRLVGRSFSSSTIPGENGVEATGSFCADSRVPIVPDVRIYQQSLSLRPLNFLQSHSMSTSHGRSMAKSLHRSRKLFQHRIRATSR